jgi:UDP-glucose 4-epimerase
MRSLSGSASASSQAENNRKTVHSYSQAYRSKVVLVTGAAGFIGSHLVDELIAAGALRVVGLDNLVAGSRENLTKAFESTVFEFVHGDVRDASLMGQMVPDVDVVFHLAASKLVVSRANPLVDLQTNLLGTFNMLSAARGRDIRVVFASTGSTLGSDDLPMSEDHRKKPSTLYGISKGAAEEYATFYAREFGLKASVIRYFHVYGPRQDYMGAAGVINIFLSRALRGKNLMVHGSGEQVRCFTHVKDDVAATLFLGARDDTVGQIYHVASPARVSVIELARKIRDKYGKPGVEIVHDEARPGENLRPVPVTAKIEALGFSTHTPFEEGLEETRHWVDADLRQRGLLP